MTIDELRERLESLEEDCTDHENTMHACIKAIGQRLERLEAHRETERAAVLDIYQKIDELRTRIDRHYMRIRALEGDSPAVASPDDEPMEPPSPCPHIRSIDEGTSYCALAEQVAQQQQPAPPAPAPAGSLVEMLEREGYNRTHGRAVIRAVAEWLDSVGNNGSASELRKEADR